jgi:hypothetical protein
MSNSSSASSKSSRIIKKEGSYNPAKERDDRTEKE